MGTGAGKSMAVRNCKANKVRAKFLGAAALAISALLACTACGEKKVQATAPPAVPVVVSTVEQKNVPMQLQAIGAVEAFATVCVKSNVGVQITEVHFRYGDFVL